jgi:hypothetical protein
MMSLRKYVILPAVHIFESEAVAKPQTSRFQKDSSTSVEMTIHAGVAQLIERFLAKEEAQGLSPCTRTKINAPHRGAFILVRISAQTLEIAQQYGV